MREELAAVHRALRHIITSLTRSFDSFDSTQDGYAQDWQGGLLLRFACGRMFHVEPGQQRKRKGLTAENAEPAEEILVKKSKAKSKKRRWRAKTKVLVGNIPNTQGCVKIGNLGKMG